MKTIKDIKLNDDVKEYLERKCKEQEKIILNLEREYSNRQKNTIKGRQYIN